MSLMGLCKMFNCLPSEILKEDAATITKMMIYENSYQAVTAIRSAQGDAIHKLPASVGKIIESLREQGIYKGGL